MRDIQLLISDLGASTNDPIDCPEVLEQWFNCGRYFQVLKAWVGQKFSEANDTSPTVGEVRGKDLVPTVNLSEWFTLDFPTEAFGGKRTSNSAHHGNDVGF